MPLFGFREGATIAEMCACLVLIVVMFSSHSYHLWDMIMLSPLFIMVIAPRYDWYNGSRNYNNEKESHS